ncbi:copper-binding protein [Nitrospirillum sp. BR 11163]|uniref:copper-binding protein n=1 Tax=Nitrospirillum sp. BR 11163 TaxID=3104323 RepID=UPI002AFF2A8D|nr:copper-binding protein [Nitrospirillum sp. BR 11163]MEA1672706.1 copper-binding protein [Nitrospirillum sp. BR 11163]
MSAKTVALATLAALTLPHASTLAAPSIHPSAPSRPESAHILPVHDRHGQQAPDEAAKPSGTGTVNAVDPARHTLNLTHGPVAALNWPGMTMDFPVAPGIDLSGVAPGSQVMFTLGKSPAGTYWVDHVMPAGAAMPAGHDHHGG